MSITRYRGKDGYELSRSELRDALGDLESVGALGLLQDFLESQESCIQEEADHGQNDTR